jgi:hypothetical protein
MQFAQIHPSKRSLKYTDDRKHDAHREWQICNFLPQMFQDTSVGRQKKGLSCLRRTCPILDSCGGEHPQQKTNLLAERQPKWINHRLLNWRSSTPTTASNIQLPRFRGIKTSTPINDWAGYLFSQLPALSRAPSRSCHGLDVQIHSSSFGDKLSGCDATVKVTRDK